MTINIYRKIEIPQRTLYSVQCTVYTVYTLSMPYVHCTLYIVHYTMYIVNTLDNKHCIA